MVNWKELIIIMIFIDALIMNFLQLNLNFNFIIRLWLKVSIIIVREMMNSIFMEQEIAVPDNKIMHILYMKSINVTKKQDMMMIQNVHQWMKSMNG